MPRKAAHCKRYKRSLKAKKELVEGYRDLQQQRVLERLKEVTGVDSYGLFSTGVVSFF